MIRIARKNLEDFDDLWIYKNFLDSSTMVQIAHYLHNNSTNLRLNYEGRKINYQDKKFTLIGTNHYRPYMKLWDFSHEEGYWNNTRESVYSFVNLKYKSYLHPALRVLVSKVLCVNPLNSGRMIAIRGIFNLLYPGVALDPHLDGGGFIVDDNVSNIYSATYYIEVDGLGGEFWDERGFVYKPEKNSLLINIGNKTTHGVRESDKLRLGVTIRFVSSDDLILEGSVDSLLYKP